ncbi:MAG: lipid-A-disaccharide synthase-related protein [Cyanobium sp.]
MRPLLLLSNGHGEDLSAALLARELQRHGLEVAAMPLVGHGGAYRREGIPVVGGATREFSTGGLGYTSLAGRLTELIQGQPLYLLGRLLWLWRHRLRYRLVLAVGDLVPVLAAWLMGQPAAVYLVAYSSHYEGRLRLPFPCSWLLRARCWRAIWSRDAFTARDLSAQLGRPVTFLGNPFLDLVAADPPGTDLAETGLAEAAVSPPCPEGRSQSLALLPGSRLPEAARNLSLMLRVLTHLPEPLQDPARLRLQAALVGDLPAEAVARLGEPLGWRLEPAPAEGENGDRDAPPELRQGQLRLQLHWGRFAAVLQGSDLVLSMTGTAAEQALGLGLPVLQLAGSGPQFTPGFAEAQRRLLGPGVYCAAGPAGDEATLAASADLAAALLERRADPQRGEAWRRELRQLAGERIGAPGGSGRLAAAIMERIRTLPQ